MADLPYQSGQSDNQRAQLRREMTGQELRYHKSHPCERDFRTIVSGVDGTEMVVLSSSPRHHPFPASTEYRDAWGYVFGVGGPRWRGWNGGKLVNSIRTAGLPSYQGDKLNHHNKKHQVIAEQTEIQKQRGCYSGEAEWRRARFSELGEKLPASESQRISAPSSHVGPRMMSSGERVIVVTKKIPVDAKPGHARKKSYGDDTYRSAGDSELTTQRSMASTISSFRSVSVPLMPRDRSSQSNIWRLHQR